MKSVLYAGVALLSFALTTGSADAEGGPVVAENYGGGGFSWDSNGGLIYRFAAFAQNDEIYICGAYTRRGGGNSRALSREAMRQATVTLNGERITRDLRFFTAASNANWSTELVGVETSCRATGHPAAGVALNDVRVEMREGRYRIRVRR